MKTFRWLNGAALALCFIVVVFGAFVRLSDAGLGCPDWPGCYGKLVVPDVAHPDYQRPLEHAKAWKEMIHRYLASTLGLLIVTLAFLSRRQDSLPKKLPWVLVGLVIFQGLLGMWTVTLLLKPLVVTGHLLGGMTTLALLAWQWLTVRRLPAEPPAPEREMRNERQAFAALDRSSVDLGFSAPAGLRLSAGFALGLLALQIFLGGWTSSNYAALGCPDLPACHGQWLPELDLHGAFTPSGTGSYEFGVLDNRARVTIHFLHRLGAVAAALLVGLLGWHLWRKGEVWRRHAVAVWAALGLQLLIGVSMVALQMPLLLAAAHNAGAAVLLLVMVHLNHACWRRQ